MSFWQFLLEISLVTKGVGQEKNSMLGGTPDLFGILINIFNLFFLQIYLSRVGHWTSKSFTTTAWFCIL